jgi:uncharacterized repeat protein (TIGR03803 family)
MDGAGNLYGTTPGNIFKLIPSGGGWIYTSLHDFINDGKDGGDSYSHVLVGGDGNLYGTTVQGGSHGYGTVWQITP